jgi:CheY-like chemotaxis protein
MRSVLLIDDDAMSRELFSILLEGEGYGVRTCDSGDAAVAMLRAESWRPDAILSDMQMPGLTGTALAETLRRLSPASVMAGMSASGAGLPAGFDIFLQKPFDGAQFTAALESLSRTGAVKQDEAGVEPDLDETMLATLEAAMPAKQLAELYALALRDTRKRVASMRESLAGGEDAAFRREAHAIKGGAAMLGARAVAGLARQMEEAGISEDASRLLEELMAAAERLEGMLLLRLPQDRA